MRRDESASTAISRIRLINFHNFVDETIDIRQGGHLFLLGDNASGKTTLLDAVHYALSAGELLEFNSAARVAGSREGGRRVQGVVMRYNVDTGPLNPDGAIAYVGLEIHGRHGAPTTIAVGMTVRSMEDKVQRWGIVRECPLQDIPFTIEETSGRRPATRQEMRDWFGAGSGFYGNIGAYQREIANRFLGGEDAFRDICRLFSMGKAYREIVSHTADYHQLFRGLLPEPHVEMFEQVISALRSLDQANADLNALEDKCAYLDTLADLVRQIDELRGEQVCLRWLRCRLLAREQTARIEQYQELREKRLAASRQLQRQIRQSRRSQEEHRKQLDDLRMKDSSGIIAQEKDLADEQERLVHSRADQTAAVNAAAAQLQTARTACGDRRQNLKQTIARLAADLRQSARETGLDLEALPRTLDALYRDDAPEDRVDDIPFEEAREQALAATREPGATLAMLNHRREQAETEAAALKNRIAEIESRTDVIPDVNGFAQAIETLRREMIRCLPLYMGLEWAPGIDAATMAAVEESIGKEVLGTILVRDEDFEPARRIVFAVAPDLRVARRPVYGDLPDWFQGVFDKARSDDGALKCLAEEMLAHEDLEIFTVNQARAVRFRGHERRLAGALPRLIGSESRREARLRELRQLRTALAETEENLLDLEKQGMRLSNGVTRLEGLRRRLDEGAAVIGRLTRDIHLHAAACEARKREHQSLKKRLEEIDEEVRCREVRLAELRRAIAREGLDQLEQHIDRARRKLRTQHEQERELHTQLGGLENQLKGIEQNIESLRLQTQSVREHQQAEETLLKALAPAIDDVRAYVEECCDAAGLPDVQSVDEALSGVARREGLAAGELTHALLHPVYGAVFGFTYNERDNELLDRRDTEVAELAVGQRQLIEEQRGIINQKTQELFRRLIVEQLLGYLSRYVRTLRDMVKRINRLLGDRAFGSSRYRLQVREVERYRRLIDIVEHFNPFEAEKAADDIRAFFEDHKEEILDTEVNAIPDVLDYRNWFHYDMRVRSTNGEGVVMDRRTKSIGSGGEQAVPNYLLILTIADFLFRGNDVRLHAMIFDEAFYGIDAGRRDQILGFATDLGLQLLVASPDQDGVKSEVAYSTTLLVVKDEAFNVHLFPYHWQNPEARTQPELLPEYQRPAEPIAFGDEL